MRISDWSSDVCSSDLIRATMSASAGSMPRRRAANVTPRYMAPVSRYSRPRRAASARATVDLPDPAGPSMAMTVMAERSSRGRDVIARHWCVRRCLGSQLVEHGPVAGEGLGHAARIGDADAVRREAEQRERHGHAVVVVGLDERGLGPARLDHKAVRLLACLRAGAPPLGSDRPSAHGPLSPK